MFMSIGTKLGGTARHAGRWAEILRRYADVVPQYPGAGVLPPYTHPAPPLLDADTPMHKKAVACACAYTRTLDHFIGPRVTKDFASPLKHDREYIKLLEAVQVMERFAIAPQAWVKFSLEVFLKYRLGRFPKPNWVFSLKRLEERQEWFSWDASFNNAQGMVWVAPEHRKLLRRYGRVRTALMREDTLDASKVQEIVDTHLPVRLYVKWQTAAVAQYQSKLTAARESLSNWEWIW